MTTVFAALALFLAPAVPDSLDKVMPALEVADAPSEDRGLEDDDIEFRGRFAPWALYSADFGFGVGAGVGVRNAITPGSDFTLDATLQQHLQGVTAAFVSSDPYNSLFHVGASLTAWTTERRRYYGLGPTTLEADKVNLFQNTLQSEIRVGVYPLGTSALYVQPSVRVRYDQSSGVNVEDSEGGIEQFGPASRAAVEVAQNVDRYGVDVGLEVASDRLDWPAYPRSGTLVTAEHRRFAALDDSELTTASYSASVTGYVPIRGRMVGILRGVGIVTRSGDADGDGLSDAIPFYYLPILDDRVATAFRPNRLTGRDVFAVGAGVRAPVVDVFGLYGLDVLVMAHLGNAYDDVFEQFSPRVSFQDASDLEDGHAALRPSLAIGAGLVNLRKEHVTIGGLIGFGPGGLQLASLQLAVDLRAPRKLFR